MTTTAPADARPDLLANPLFQAVCSAWQRDGRAFVGFADVLMEWGMEAEAAAWVWAATEPDRPSNQGIQGNGGIYPVYYPDLDTGQPWRWMTRSSADERDDLPEMLSEKSSSIPFASFPAAILWFLKRSAEVYGAAGPPRVEVPEVAGV